jgi:hypothetical protein
MPKVPSPAVVAARLHARRFALSSVAVAALTLGSLGFTSALAHAQFSRGNPFAPPAAKTFYAPDRDYDLQHLAVTLNVDYPKRTFEGTTVNTVAPLRKEGLTKFRFHCGKNV